MFELPQPCQRSEPLWPWVLLTPTPSTGGRHQAHSTSTLDAEVVHGTVGHVCCHKERQGTFKGPAFLLWNTTIVNHPLPKGQWVVMGCFSTRPPKHVHSSEESWGHSSRNPGVSCRSSTSQEGHLETLGYIHLYCVMPRSDVQSSFCLKYLPFLLPSKTPEDY